MKKGYLILLITLCCANVFAQTKDEKIKTLKVAYITEKLDLSTSEAEKFWPIYNTFEEQNDTMRREIRNLRKNIDIESISEANANKMLSQMIQSNDNRHDLFNQYIKDLQTVLPAKKIILLKKTEDDFKRKLFDEYKKRHKDDKK